VIDSCEDISVMMQGNLKGQDIIRGENNAWSQNYISPQ
jgi:hypothetical protein